MDIKTLLLTTLSSSALTTTIIYVSKTFILNKLKKDLENHKHLLEIQLIKIQLRSKEVMEYYQLLFEKIEMALGETLEMVSALQMQSDWSDSNSKDVEKYLLKNNASDLKIQEFKKIFDEIQSDRAKKLNKYIDSLKLVNVYNLHREAKNFLIIKALYLNEEIESLSREILTLIINEVIEYEVYKETRDLSYYKRENKDGKHIIDKVVMLKKLLRKELIPESLY
jgi:hypothetical protein